MAILIKRPNSSTEQEVVVFTLFEDDTVVAGGTKESKILNIEHCRGFFTLQQELSGDGAIKWQYLLSNNGSTFLVPQDAVEIATSQTKTSGDGSGNNFFAFSPEVAKYMKIRATETGGNNSVTISGYLAVQ